MRGREESPSGSYGAPENQVLPRRADSASFGKDAALLVPLHKCRVQRRFHLRGSAQQGYASALPGRNPVRGPSICAAMWRVRRGREVPGKERNARRDKTSHERHNRIVHCTVTECSIPAAANLSPRRLTAILHRSNRSAAGPVLTPANPPEKCCFPPCRAHDVKGPHPLAGQRSRISRYWKDRKAPRYRHP
jgi:hypothetical protein